MVRFLIHSFQYFVSLWTQVFVAVVCCSVSLWIVSWSATLFGGNSLHEWQASV